MDIEISHKCTDFNSYRAARVKSLFNCEDGSTFSHTAKLDIDDRDWQIGVVVGPSGSGKTSIGRELFGPGALLAPGPEHWPADKPVIDAIAPDGEFDAVHGALAAVGLGSVPTWLRPYSVLSMGERFRADMARLICDRPDAVVVDEFTSVVDRQIAKVGAGAFAKSWRRGPGQVVLLSCHYDVLDWLEPDWVYDTRDGSFKRGSLWRRPSIEVEIRKTGWSFWPLFEPHHYMKANPMVGGVCYVATVDGEPVAHLGVSSMSKGKRAEARACRLVVMPEWQGAGIGLRFLNWCAQLQAEGTEGARLKGRRVTTAFHTSHPGLAAALRRDRRWRQMSANLYGQDNGRARKTPKAKRVMTKSGQIITSTPKTGHGGHWRAVQGFRYYGERAAK